MMKGHSGVLSLLKDLCCSKSDNEEGQRTYEHRFGNLGAFLSLHVIRDIIRELEKPALTGMNLDRPTPTAAFAGPGAIFPICGSIECVQAIQGAYEAGRKSMEPQIEYTIVGPTAIDLPVCSRNPNTCRVAFCDSPKCYSEPVGCILDCDSASYPPEPEEYAQCVQRRCLDCLKHIQRMAKKEQQSREKCPITRKGLQCVACERARRLALKNDVPVRLGEIANFARQRYKGQMGKYRDAGEPYVRHLERVVKLVNTYEEKAVAWLHDIIEDTATSIPDLEKLEMPKKVLDAVKILTRTYLGNDNYHTAYIMRVMQSGNALAIAVKIADLKDHLRPGCPMSHVVKYAKALSMLKDCVPS